MKQIQANRLTSMVNMLNSLPKQATFNINHWANSNGRTTKPTLKAAVDCGTSACAVGWAILLIPAWKKAFKFKGISLTTSERGNYELPLDAVYEKIAAFVGITPNDAEHLFAPQCYKMESHKVTGAKVAKRITSMLAAHGYNLH